MALKDLYSLGALKTKIQEEFNKFQTAFTQHVTGAVSRHTADAIDFNDTTVQATLEMLQVLNVQLFGAAGDGITDDYAAIQAAIDAVPQKGGRVFLPAGTYKITNTLALNGANRPVELFGEGSGEQIHGTPPGGGTVLVWGGAAPAPVIEVTGNGKAIRHLAVDNGVAGANAATHGIRAVSGASGNLRIDGVVMFPDSGLGFTPAAIEIGGAAGDPLVGAHLNDVYLRNNTMGLLLKQTISTKLDMCRFIDCTTGLQLGTATTTTIATQFYGCVFEARTGGTDISIVRAQSVLFSGCQIDAYGPQRGVDILATATLADSIEFQSCRFIGLNGATHAIKVDFASCSLLINSCFFTGFATASINNANNKRLLVTGCHNDDATPFVDSYTIGDVRALSNDVSATGPVVDRIGGTVGVVIGAGATIKNILTVLANWRPNGGVQIANGAAAVDGTITVTGAVRGDTVLVGFKPEGVDTTPAGCLFVGTVTVDGTVTVSLLNFSGGPLTYNSLGGVRVDVIQH